MSLRWTIQLMNQEERNEVFHHQTVILAFFDVQIKMGKLELLGILITGRHYWVENSELNQEPIRDVNSFAKLIVKREQTLSIILPRS